MESKKLLMILAILVVGVMFFSAASPVIGCAELVHPTVTEDCNGYTVSANPETFFEDRQGQGNDKWYATQWVPTSVSGTGTFSWIALEKTHTATVTVTWTKYTRTSADGDWSSTGVTQSGSSDVTAKRPSQCNFTFCHIAGLASDPANYNQHTNVPLEQVLGHFFENGTVRAGHENDYLGVCNPPPPPPTYCVTTVDGETTWDDEWVVAADGLSRTKNGSVATWDAVETTHPCEPRAVSDTEYLYCEPDGVTTNWYHEGEAPVGATIGLCPIPPEPGSANVAVGTCHWVEGKSVKDVVITIDHATFTIDGANYTESETIQLPSGTYDWSWIAVDPYAGSDKGQLIIEASCEPLPPPPPSEDIMIAPITGANQTAKAAAVGGSLLTGIALIFGALRKLIFK